MMAINHAATGALIGLTVDEPFLALPLSFVSHFVLDAIPHYDPVEGTNEEKISSKKFFYIQIVLGALLCFLLILLLSITQPKRWLVAAGCAFLGASPDLLSFPRYLSVKQTGMDIDKTNWFWSFHSWIQWRTGPDLLWTELVWLGAIGFCVAGLL
ncbi:hypothetical protein H7097_01160 [Aeromicrobium sp.]|nr:hypothetical protein [Candidatus Saccharibacteria bacterium]